MTDFYGPGFPTSVMTAAAMQSTDRPIEFSAPPRLESAVATRNQVAAPNVIYYLTIRLPDAAGVPLDRITVELTEGRRDPIFRYRLEATKAFEGTRQNRGADVPLGELSQDTERKSISIAFEPAIAPGATMTVELVPERNPRFSGTYLFAVTGYPYGEPAEAAFMGYARLSFYDSNDGFPVFP